MYAGVPIFFLIIQLTWLDNLLWQGLGSDTEDTFLGPWEGKCREPFYSGWPAATDARTKTCHISDGGAGGFLISLCVWNILSKFICCILYVTEVQSHCPHSALPSPDPPWQSAGLGLFVGEDGESEISPQHNLSPWRTVAPWDLTWHMDTMVWKCILFKVFKLLKKHRVAAPGVIFNILKYRFSEL